MRWKKIFHRKIQRNSYKNSPLSAHSTLKDAGALRWKKFFSPLFTANLTLFFDKTSTRVGTSFWALSSPSSPTWPAPANIELQLTPKRWLKAPRSLNASLVPVSTKWTRPTRLKQSVTLAFKSLFTSKSFWNLLKMRRSIGSCKAKT